jgi:hypothetical protein
VLGLFVLTGAQAQLLGLLPRSAQPLEQLCRWIAAVLAPSCEWRRLKRTTANRPSVRRAFQYAAGC